MVIPPPVVFLDATTARANDSRQLLEGKPIALRLLHFGRAGFI
jgi:hypothetical protein